MARVVDGVFLEETLMSLDVFQPKRFAFLRKHTPLLCSGMGIAACRCSNLVLPYPPWTNSRDQTRAARLAQARATGGRGVYQAVMTTGTALDDDEIARLEIADPRGVERDHRRLCSLIVLIERPIPADSSIMKFFPIYQPWTATKFPTTRPAPSSITPAANTPRSATRLRHLCGRSASCWPSSIRRATPCLRPSPWGTLAGAAEEEAAVGSEVPNQCHAR
jgi:hypothetical protein